MSSSLLRCSRAASTLLLAALCVPLAAFAQRQADPFDTQRLLPRAPSSFWQGPAEPAPCPDPSAVPDPLRLVEAIDLALCHNPRTRQSWAIARQRAAEVGQARSAQLPSVDGQIGIERLEVRNIANPGGTTLVPASIGFTYLLFDFGGRDASIELARESLLAANWSHNATLQAVMLDAIAAYYLLFSAREAVDATVAAERSALQSLEAARARLKAGSATRADVLQAQTAYSQAVFNRNQAEGQAARSQGVLANVLGISPDRNLAIVPPPDLEAQRVIERSVGELLAVARTKRPDLAAAEASVRAAESNVRVRESAGKPTVSLFGAASAIASNPGPNPLTGRIGLSLNIPIFTGYSDTYRIQQAREQVREQAATRDRVADDLTLEVWRSYQDLRTEGQSLTTANDLVASAQESFNVALGRYRAGVGTVIDLLNAQSSLSSALVQRIEARLRWNVAKAALARAIGVLDPDLVTTLTGAAATTAPRAR
jgi:TolC family type I secretion outer membrane protein